MTAVGAAAILPPGSTRVWLGRLPNDGPAHHAAFLVDPDGHNLEALHP